MRRSEFFKRKPTRIIVAVSALAVLASAVFVNAWTGPTSTPPGGDVAAPINTSSTGQIKSGNLGVTGYLNFGSTLGSSGYGVWDNGGTLEFKNSGGSWSTLQATIYNYVGGGGQWVNGTSGAIYYTGGNVGIGTVKPAYTLEVNGDIGADENMIATGDLYDGAIGTWVSQLVTPTTIVVGSSAYLGNYHYCAWGGGQSATWGIYPVSGEYYNGTYTWFVYADDGDNRINCF
jgi:hypothetical protein